MNFHDKHKPELPTFQITPMIDIIFLLLCFFISSQIFAQWESEIDIQLPTSKLRKAPDRLPGEIIINVRRDGTIVVNQQVLSENGLASLLGDVVRLFKGQPVLIRADKATAYEHIIKVLDVCRLSDVWNVSFATALPESAPAARRR